MLVKWGKNRGRAVAGNFWRKGGKTPLPCPTLFCLLLLCTWDALCKGIDARDIYEQIVAVAELSCTQNGRYISLWAQNHTQISAAIMRIRYLSTRQITSVIAEYMWCSGREGRLLPCQFFGCKKRGVVLHSPSFFVCTVRRKILACIVFCKRFERFKM